MVPRYPLVVTSVSASASAPTRSMHSARSISVPIAVDSRARPHRPAGETAHTRSYGIPTYWQTVHVPTDRLTTPLPPLSTLTRYHRLAGEPRTRVPTVSRHTGKPYTFQPTDDQSSALARLRLGLCFSQLAADASCSIPTYRQTAHVPSLPTILTTADPDPASIRPLLIQLYLRRPTTSFAY